MDGIGEEFFAVIDELVSGSIDDGVFLDHFDGIARASFDAVSAEDATQFINGEELRIFIAIGAIVFGSVIGDNGDTLSGASGGAHEASDAFNASLFIGFESMFASESIGIRFFDFGVLGGKFFDLDEMEEGIEKAFKDGEEVSFFQLRDNLLEDIQNVPPLFIER